MTKLVTRYLKDESGATAIEYGLIAALVSVVLIAILTTLGTTLKAKFAAICKGLNNDTACAGA